MADFSRIKESLGSIALTAAMTLGGTAPTAAEAQVDTSKLSPAVVEKCRADTAATLSEFRAKIEVANAKPGVTDALKAQREERARTQEKTQLESCLASAASDVRVAALDQKVVELDGRIAVAQQNKDESAKKMVDLDKKWVDLDKKWVDLDKKWVDLDKANQDLDTIIAEASRRTEIFDNFMLAKKSRDQLNAEIVSLNPFITKAVADIERAKQVVAGHPSAIAKLARAIAAIKELSSRAPGAQVAKI